MSNKSQKTLLKIEEMEKDEENEELINQIKRAR